MISLAGLENKIKYKERVITVQQEELIKELRTKMNPVTSPYHHDALTQKLSDMSSVSLL